jgi:hypothetical protein
MNFLALQTRTIERLGEAATPVYHDLPSIKEALNKAQRLFCLLTLCLEKTATYNLSANTAFYLPSASITDFLVPLRVRMSTGSRLYPATIHELNNFDSNWRVTTGTPNKYVTQGFDLLALAPVPAAGGSALSITYAATPAVLAANGDTPEIPEEIQDCLIDYALYLLRLKEGGQELQKTLPRLNDFLNTAQLYGEFVRARSKAQLYDKEPPDLSTFDRSRLMKLILASQKGTTKR